MAGEIKYRFELWGTYTGNFYGSMLAQGPDVDDLDIAYELNEFYDRTRRYTEMFLGFSEVLRVEYVPDPIILRAVPDQM